MAHDPSFRQIAEMQGGVAWILELPAQQLSYISPAVADLLGHTAEKLCSEPLPPFLLAGLDERLARFAQGDVSRRELAREHELAAKDGSLVPVVIVSAIASPTRLVGAIRDNRPAREHLQARKRFASMLNHEFRTPLATIDGAIQRLEATHKNADEATRARYTKIQGAVDRLIGMLDEHLSPDVMQSIGHKQRVNGVAPQALLDEAAALVQAAGRHVQQHSGILPAMVRCEPSGLRMVLKVLVENAIQFTPASAVITLSASQIDSNLQFTVSDNGPGIAAADVAKIFDKNYRGQNAAGFAGNGLGLYLARSVIEVHGGSLNVAATPGGGASFIVLLPIGKNLASHGNTVDNSYNQYVGSGKDSK